jgi:hypothetical protein
MVVRAVFALDAYMFSGAFMAARGIGHPWVAWFVAAPAMVSAPGKLVLLISSLATFTGACGRGPGDTSKSTEDPHSPPSAVPTPTPCEVATEKYVKLLADYSRCDASHDCVLFSTVLVGPTGSLTRGSGCIADQQERTSGQSVRSRRAGALAMPRLQSDLRREVGAYMC